MAEPVHIDGDLVELGCSCYRLRQAARLTSRAYDRYLAPCGISIAQFGVLATLAAMEGHSIKRIAGVLKMDRTTLTRNLVPLEMSGYIVSVQAEDKRAKMIGLTELGWEKFLAAKPLWEAAQQSLEAHLGTAEVQHLDQVLDLMLHGLSGG